MILILFLLAFHQISDKMAQVCCIMGKFEMQHNSFFLDMVLQAHRLVVTIKSTVGSTAAKEGVIALVCQGSCCLLMHMFSDNINLIVHCLGQTD